MARLQLEKVSITDKFGHEVQPGEKVGFMTFASHSCHFGQGIYQGLANKGARILEDYEITTSHDPVTGDDRLAGIAILDREADRQGTDVSSLQQF